jgi:hypothetical protein
MSALKDNKTKIRLSYIHPRTKEEIALAHMAGAKKYEEWNFLKGHKYLDLLDAIERHVDKLKLCEDIDEDSTAILGQQVHHLGCIGANVNMLIAQMVLGTLIDDRIRFRKPPKE